MSLYLRIIGIRIYTRRLTYAQLAQIDRRAHIYFYFYHDYIVFIVYFLPATVFPIKHVFGGDTRLLMHTMFICLFRG